MKKLRKDHRKVWNKEYRTGEHLKLSKEPGEDLLKSIRSIERETGRQYLNPLAQALDLGCGNGRHLIYLAQTFGMRGIGYDVSNEAIGEARAASDGLPLAYAVRSIAGDFDEIKDGSVTMCLDLMSSHFLRKAEREHLREEIVRVLKPGGWLIFKSFLSEEDLNVKWLLREHPADEEGAYIHPEFGVYEYTWTLETLREFFEPCFEIKRVDKSHRHLDRQGRPNKRRTITAVMQKLG